MLDVGWHIRCGLMGEKLSVQFCAFCEPFKKLEVRSGKMEVGWWMWGDRWWVLSVHFCVFCEPFKKLEARRWK